MNKFKKDNKKNQINIISSDQLKNDKPDFADLVKD
jgi:hypothetical protein